MKTYHIECMETNSFIVEVEAQSEDEARELVNNDVNSFEIVEERVSDWEINLVEEIVWKWAVKLYVAGKLFEEKVHAVNYQDAKETALARNPKAKVVSVNPTYQD